MKIDWNMVRKEWKSWTRFFLAVALIVWAYNIGHSDAVRLVEYINQACGPGSATLEGGVVHVWVTADGTRIDKNTMRPMWEVERERAMQEVLRTIHDNDINISKDNNQSWVGGTT